MGYELLVQDKSVTGRTFDLAPLTETVTLKSERTGSAGSLEFDMIKAGEVSFHEGDPVRFSVDGRLLFYGYVFEKEQNRWGEISVTCYDQVRYLKMNASYAFSGMTAGGIIRKLAADYGLAVGTVEETGYVIPSLVCEDKECFDMISDAVQQTIVNTGRVYVFFDDCGALSLREAGHMKSDVVIGERSLVTDYSYKTSIDSDVYNSVKLARPNEETGKTDIYIVEDSYNIGRWGLLRYYEQVDESMNPAQIRQQAETMLTYYDELKRTLSIDCLGIPGLRAGQMVFLNLPNLGDISLSKYVLLESVEHTFENDVHTMSIETRAISGVE